MVAGDISAPGNGITWGYSGESIALKVTIATLAGITWYNAIELVALVFVTFSQYRGLYFWSLLISSSVGLIPYTLGFLLKFFNLTSQTWLSVTLITVGWYCMVTGQSVVLYSRLYLVLPNPRILPRVLAMIIINVIILHIPTTVFTYGSNLASGTSGYVNGYNVMEKIQMTGFCIQEFILSGLYIWETVRMLRFDPDRGKRKIMYQLVAINLIIILMDLGLLVIEYMDYYILETMVKGVVYSVKLKLEFAVLGKLIYLVRSHVWKQESVTGPPEFPDFVDATRVTSDLTHAAPTALRQRSHYHHPWMDSDDISIAMFEHSGLARESGTGHSSISHALSGDTQTNNNPCSERDFTDLPHRLPPATHIKDSSPGGAG